MNLPGIHVLWPVFAGCPGDLYLAAHVWVDQVHVGQLVDGQVHLAQGQPVQLELDLDPEILPIFEAEILDNAWGQPQVQYGLARVLNGRQVGYAILAVLAICGFFYVILTVFAFQK